MGASGPAHRRVIAALPHLPAHLRGFVPPPAERCGTAPIVGAARVFASMLRQLCPGPNDVSVTLGSARVTVDLDTAHGRRLFAYGFGEPAARAMRSLVRPGDVVVDGGANIGLFTVLAATLVGCEGWVVACEPAPTTMALLRDNVERNDLHWVVLREAALADAPGRLALRAFEPGSGYSSFAPADVAGGVEVEVDVATLDELAGDLIDRVTLVKLDVEGAELRALRGASDLLSRARPDFVVELEAEHLARQGSSIDEVQALFDDAGYVGYAIGERGLVALRGTWQRPAGDPNIVVRPRERAESDVRVLMVNPFPRGGIGSYTDQAAARLRELGHSVVVVSSAPTGAEPMLDVTRRGAARSFMRMARRCELLIVQFQPEMLGGPDSTLLTRGRALLRLAAGMWTAPSVELCVHEFSHGKGWSGVIMRRLVSRVWALADEVTVHTEGERRDFADAFGVSPERIRVVSQGQYMLRRTDTDRVAARAALGLPAEPVVLLAIGFLQPHKGFDRAIRAFAAAGAAGGQLYVVGSLWREDPVSCKELEELCALARVTPGVEVREGYLSDEDFDRWIVASDAVVLPYRSGASSNVMERGLLYDRPVIMSRVGGMAEQGSARPGVTLVGDDDALFDAVRRLLGELALRPR